MAKQIEDIVVQLGIKGFEELNKLRSSFRELTKVTKGTDEQLNDARKRLLELKTELGDTARANKGLTDAFTALVGEAKRGSTVWQDLNRDLSKLRQEARLTDTQITALRDIIIDESKVHAQSAVSIREHIKSLQDLRNQASLNGKVHQQLGADIQKLTTTLEEGAVSNRKHYSSLTQILGVKPDAVLRQWEAYTRILQEGTASADKLAVAQRRLNQLSGAPRILERRRITASAEITQDPEYLRRFGFEGASLPALPNTNAAYAQQIKELQQDLQHLDRSSIQYLQTVMQLAGVQRQATEVIRGYAQALVMGLDTKVVERSSRNLQEAITALRSEMQQLDTTTAEGSATYAANANSVRKLEQELKKLGDSYRHVGDMATQAATAEQNAANARIRNNYLNRSLVAQQEQALADLGQRVRAGVSGTPLLLPAAGQTSARGTGLEISGGANVRVGRRRSVTDVIGNIPVMGVRPGSGVQRFFGSADVEAAALYPGAVPIGPRMTSRKEGENRTQVIAETDARRANAEAVEQQRQRMKTLRAAVDQATKANTGSINSLANLREALANLRNELPATDKNFKQLTNRLQDVDQRANRLSTNVGRKLTGMQLAQGVGAALSGGIFGGPEGLIGGLGGLAIGGVGGSFAGAAFGAQVGMFRQQLGAVTEYSARIDKLQIALRGIVGSQDAYSQALAAAASVTRDLNIPQESAIQGMTRLSAAVLGAGGNVNDSAFAFTAIAKAIKATGGNAEQADGAILALTQVFSKGKVSAEELNQIAERLPGTFTLFAKATGRTGPELQKALQDGKVGLNDLMKFLGSIDTQYGQTALRIAKSTQDAGARLTVATQAMQRDVGKALQPIGAQLQDAFANFITNITPSLVLGANAISVAIRAMYNAISAGFNILKNMSGLISGLTKTMIVFAGVSAGVFVASNITTFAGAIRNLVGVFRGLLSIQRALLAVETARAGAQALIAGLAAGATKGKVVGAILGGVAGAGVALGLGKIIEGVMKSVTDKIDTSISGMKDIPFTQFTAPTGAEGSAGGGRRAAKPEQLEVGGMLMNLNLDARQLLNTQLKSLETQIQAAYKDNNIALGDSLELKKEDIILDLKLKALRDEENKITSEIQKAQAKGLDTRQAELKLREVMIAYDETFRESEVLRTKRLKEQAQVLADINQQLVQAFGPQQLGIFGEIPQQFTFERDPAFTPVGGTQREEIKRVADDLKKLTDPLTQLTSAAESLGSAFSTSFTSIISGSATAQQALATLFTNISNYFLDMAGKIIAKWIEMALLNTILSLFPSSGFGKIGVGSASMNLPGLEGAGALTKGGTGLFTNYDYSSFAKANAMGNAYASNGIVPFAMGAVVKRPTMFAFANGGAGRLGLMGEAGPEAIMPLRRLPSGRLGVESTGGGAPINVNVTVDATGTNVQGNAGQANQLGSVVASAVQAELIKQKRPGGLLSS